MPRRPHLTPEEAREVRELYGQARSGPGNWSVAQLARSFGVSAAVIRAAIDQRGAYAPRVTPTEESGDE